MSTISSIRSRNIVQSVSAIRALQFGGRPRVGNSTLNLARVGVRDFMTKLVAAGEAIKDLHADFAHLKGNYALRKPAFMKGTERINLDQVAPTVTLSSTDELSTHTTTIDDRAPAFGVPLSTSQVGIHGTYTGTSDAEWEIEPADGVNFTVGQATDYNFDVYKDGTYASSFVVPGGYAEGDRVSIGDGLAISFTSGKVFTNDSVTFNALTGLDLTAQTDVSFDQSIDYTLLDSEVTSGSFDINGETITVSDTDTLKDVLTAINDSDAGVTAEYNAGTDEVILSTSDGSSIVVENDTSGVLTAMKLDGAVEEVIESGELGQVIEDVAALSSVTSGSFEINGVTFTVDVSTDSLQDVIDSVNNDTTANAEILYSENTDRLLVRSTQDDETLTIANDTTGLFAAFGISEGVRRPMVSRGFRQTMVRNLVEQLHEVEDLFNELAGPVVNEGLMSEYAMKARNKIRSEIETYFGNLAGEVEDSGIGLEFILEEDSSRPFMKFGSAGADKLERALYRRPSEVLDILFGTKDDDGLVDVILKGLDKAQDTLIDKYGSVGLLLDITV